VHVNGLELTLCVNENIQHEMCKYKFKNKYVYMVLCNCGNSVTVKQIHLYDHVRQCS
jgi:hypothetical protein